MAGELLDLTQATVVTPADAGPVERRAVRVLVDEVERRTRIRWTVLHAWPDVPGSVVAIGLAASADAFAGRLAAQLTAHTGAEGFQIRSGTQSSGAPYVLIAGNDARGVLYGAGRLLRELRTARDRVDVPAGFATVTTPRYALRGHQLGYRPKTNAYDGWDEPLWDRYLRDLTIFGCNAIELIPPRSDDDADGPHLPKPQLEMMETMSRLADGYGLDVWIWFPAMDEDYTDPDTITFALDEWAEVFERLPRIDAVFVPGGDPGHTSPVVLLDFLAQQAGSLRHRHPDAQMWVSPQSFGADSVDEFYAYLCDRQPAWLHGVVFGPQCRMSLPELRAALPRRYPIRRYPDITHSLRCQYPVNDWDLAYALTEEREIINPRPRDQQQIFKRWESEAVGFVTYSEGCNDDVNKAVWSALGWDPNADMLDILRQYARHYLSSRWADELAQGILALERNWDGPLLANVAVDDTLHKFQAIERATTPREKLNWRFQQLLYRAYYDAYLRRRLIQETELESRALDELARADRLGSLRAIDRAEHVLDQTVTDPVGLAWRARVFELAEALYQSIRMQLSVPRYQAIAPGRGANLDLIDRPLNDREWLMRQFADIRATGDESERLARIAGVVGWTDPGPGGWYDDLGNPQRQPQLVRGPDAADDPEYRERSLVGFAYEPGWRQSWCRHAESRYDAPLRLRYDGLDPTSRYRVRVVYAGDRFDAQIRLSAGDGIEIQPYMQKPRPPSPVEFDVPQGIAANGQLTLTWETQPGLGGAGRGCQVAEVWLLKV